MLEEIFSLLGNCTEREGIISSMIKKFDKWGIIQIMNVNKKYIKLDGIKKKLKENSITLKEFVNLVLY